MTPDDTGTAHAATVEPTGTGTVAAFVAVSMWGLGNVIVASIDMNGLAIGTWRLGLGAVVYFAVLTARGGRLTARSFRDGWKGGLAFGLDIATFFLAVRNTTVAIAVTLSALQPIVIAGFAAAMFGERIRRRHIVATAVAVPGIALVAFASSDGGTHSVFGDVMAVLALFVWAAYFIASKKARQTLPLMEYMTVLNLMGFLTVGALALVTGNLAGGGGLTWTNALWICLVLAVPGSGHIVMNWAHNHTTLMLTSLATLTMPVTSTAAAWIFLDQSVSAAQMAGIAAVLTALTFVVVGDSRAAGTRV